MNLRAFLLPLTAMFCVSASAGQVIEMQVVDLPPYLIAAPDGHFGGIVVDAATRAFERAGIAVKLTDIPALRQLERLKANREALCSVGWYKTPERETFARFSDPITRDERWAALVAPKWKLPPQMTVDALLAEPDLTLLLKQGFSNGEYLDKKLPAARSHRVTTTSEMSGIFKMIEAGHGDVFFAPRDEIRYFEDAGLFDAQKVSIVTFTDLPLGQQRYLMCSKRVGNDILARFNAALRQQGKASN